MPSSAGCGGKGEFSDRQLRTVESCMVLNPKAAGDAGVILNQVLACLPVGSMLLMRTQAFYDLKL